MQSKSAQNIQQALKHFWPPDTKKLFNHDKMDDNFRTERRTATRANVKIGLAVCLVDKEHLNF